MSLAWRDVAVGVAGMALGCSLTLALRSYTRNASGLPREQAIEALEQEQDRQRLLRRCQQEVPEEWPPLLCEHRPDIPVPSASPLSPTFQARPELRVLTLNMLADGLSGNCEAFGGFHDIPEEGLTWPLRKYKLLEELVRSDADVICLQEVDHYHDFFEPQLAGVGYAGVFREDPLSPCITASLQPGLKDGVAIFYKRDKFELVERFLSPTHTEGGGELANSAMARLRRRDVNSKRNALALEVQAPYASSLVDGLSRIETRGYDFPTRLLGQPILVMESPAGGVDACGIAQAKVIGEITIGRSFKYKDRARWEEDQATVSPAPKTDGTPFRWLEDRTFGWEVLEARRFEEPVPLSAGMVQRQFRSFFSVGAAPEVIVATTHFHSKKNKQGELKRQDQMQHLLRQLESFSRHSPDDAALAVPLVLTGDFNAVQDELCFHALRQSGFGLRDAYAEAGVSTTPGCFTSWKIRRGSYKPGEHKYWIDYIFFRGAKCVSVAELPSTEDIGPGALPSLAWPSDHLSLAARFSLDHTN